ncbi:MAG: undecaprenyl-diphosphate phosphatase [Clostridia bacterium]|nr:undecaprenyl-diphosphate phosphatase [Clostridia bacterium]
MNIIQAAILGLVQGLAEFLPVSSSGHLILARSLMGIEAAAQTGTYIMLDVLLHAGTLLAIVIVFWKDWWDMVFHPIKNHTLVLLIVASLPALVANTLFGDMLETFFSGWFLGCSFLITAVFLMLAEALSAKKRPTADKPGLKHAIIMGVMQAIALLPGVSRSGSTLTGGLASRLDRKAAAKFAFMMSAPAILGSLIFEGKDAIEMGYLQELALVPTLVGVAVAAVSGYFAVRFMMRVVSKSSLYWFALYVAVLGFVVLLLQLAGSPLVPAFVIPAITPAG